MGIRGDRIAAVGNLAGAPARRVLDVTGHMVAPGSIDIHSHADRRLLDADPRARGAPSLVAQGVTMVVVNQDGRSPWPIRDRVVDLRRLGHGPNVVVLVGHGEVRGHAMAGDVERPATPDEVARMQALVGEGMADGAWGISAGLEYAPGRWSVRGRWCRWHLRLPPARRGSGPHVVLAVAGGGGAAEPDRCGA